MIHTKNKSFTQLMNSIESLLAHENAVMLEKGTLTLENLMGHKRAMLEEFTLCLDETLFEDPQNLEKIKEVQKAIRLNTALQQAQPLQRKMETTRLKNKIIAQAKGISDYIFDNEGNTTCH